MSQVSFVANEARVQEIAQQAPLCLENGAETHGPPLELCDGLTSLSWDLVDEDVSDLMPSEATDENAVDCVEHADRKPLV